MAKAVLDALKATGAGDLQAAIDAVSAQMFKIKDGGAGTAGKRLLSGMAVWFGVEDGKNSMAYLERFWVNVKEWNPFKSSSRCVGWSPPPWFVKAIWQEVAGKRRFLEETTPNDPIVNPEKVSKYL